MNIKDVKTCFKIADVKLIPNSTKLDFVYLDNIKDENGKNIDKKILSKNVARVYLVVVDGEVKKIGGSQAKGGIKSTLNIYKDGGINGRPSIRSYGMWYFLYHNMLENNKRIEFYMIYQDNFSTEIKGLFGYSKCEDAYISYKLIENYCKTDFRNKEGMLPEWNVQEQARDWSDTIKREHSDIYKTSIVKKNKRYNRVSVDFKKDDN